MCPREGRRASPRRVQTELRLGAPSMPWLPVVSTLRYLVCWSTSGNAEAALIPEGGISDLLPLFSLSLVHFMFNNS